jgi:type II secretory pathway predicted ATPase ExeA
MLANVQAHFGLTRPFHRVGNYETEHQRTLVREVCAVVQTGRLVVVAGLVGSGKTHLLTRIEDELARSSKIAMFFSMCSPTILNGWIGRCATSTRPPSTVRSSSTILSMPSSL